MAPPVPSDRPRASPVPAPQAPAVRLRPVTDDDGPFLLEVYASHRREELDPLGWDEPTRAAFLAMQFEAQQLHYATHYPQADHRTILVDGAPAGRIYVARLRDEIRLLDVTLLHDRRGRGVGTGLLDGRGLDRVLDLQPHPGFPVPPEPPAGTSQTVEIRALTVRNGAVDGFGGGLFLRPGPTSVHLVDVDVVGNAAQNASGGGVAVAVGASLRLTRTWVQGNRADFNGGGIFCFGGTVIVDDPDQVAGNAAGEPGDDPEGAGLGGDDLFLAHGVEVDPGPGVELVTTEAGGTAAFTVRLNRPPAGPLRVLLTSSNPAEGTVSPETLDFGPEDWMTAKEVTVTGADDPVDDGDQPYRVRLALVLSDSGASAPLNPGFVPLLNRDDDEAGFVVGALSGPTDEDGAQATFTVALASRPVAEVQVAVGTSDPGEALAAPGLLVFPPESWDVPTVVTVTGQDDALCDGDEPFVVALAPASSADPASAGLDPPDVAGVNRHVDRDEVLDCADNRPGVPNPDQLDGDRDEAGGLCDPCPGDPLDGLDGDVDGTDAGLFLDLGRPSQLPDLARELGTTRCY
ncbi:MAG: hypothetical protein Kow0092_05430 [Deferrisomatales bacterium]